MGPMFNFNLNPKFYNNFNKDTTLPAQKSYMLNPNNVLQIKIDNEEELIKLLNNK